MTLPVAAEIHRRAAADHQPDDRADLQTSAVPSVIFSPGQFPRVSQKIDSGDMMIMADLAAPRSGEEGVPSPNPRNFWNPLNSMGWASWFDCLGCFQSSQKPLKRSAAKWV